MTRSRRPRTGSAGADRAPAASTAAADARIEALAHGLPWAITILALVAIVTLCVVKYHFYLYKDFDLAIFTEALVRLRSGSLDSTIRGMPWLADHASYVMFLLAPLFDLAPHPITLLVVQSVAIALAAIPLARLARETLPGRWVPALVTTAYLMHPAVGHTALFEFHPEVIGGSALVAAFVALVERRDRTAVAWSVLALLVKEDVALVVAPLGVWAALTRGRGGRRAGVLLVLLALVSLVVTFVIVRPLGNRGESDYGRLYAAWGPDVRSALTHMVTRPWEVAGAMINTVGDPLDGSIKRGFWLGMLGPLLFAPLAAPLVWLLPMPVVIAHLTSSHPQAHMLYFQYTALVTPLWIAAAVLGTRRLLALGGGSAATAGQAAPRSRAARLATLIWIAIAAGTLFAQVRYGPLASFPGNAPAKPSELAWPGPYDRTLQVVQDSVLRRVPREGDVVAGFGFLLRVLRKDRVESLHHVARGRYTASDRAYPLPRSGVVALVGDMSGLGHFLDSGSAARLAAVLDSNRLAPSVAVGDVVCFTRGVTDSAELTHPAPEVQPDTRGLTYDGALTLLAWSTPPSEVPAGGEVKLRTYWRRVAAVDRLYAMQIYLHQGARTIHAHLRPMGYGIRPPDGWPRDVVMADVVRFLVPAGTPPGDYDLSFLFTWRRDDGSAGPAVPDEPAVRRARGMVRLGALRVIAPLTAR